MALDLTVCCVLDRSKADSVNKSWGKSVACFGSSSKACKRALLESISENVQENQPKDRSDARRLMPLSKCQQPSTFRLASDGLSLSDISANSGLPLFCHQKPYQRYDVQ
eukprot:scaffold34693_cov60-Cyclotella_meneghiniana.AAC.4